MTTTLLNSMAYSTVRGGYLFAGDGDWFTFSGTLGEYHGGGALQANKWYTPEQLGLDSWDNHDPNDRIMFDYVSNQTGWGSGGLTMESYHDTNSGQTIDNIDNATSYSGFSYLEGELKANGLVYEVGPELRTIDLAGSSSQPQRPVVPSTPVGVAPSGTTIIIEELNNWGNIVTGDGNNVSNENNGFNLVGTSSSDRLTGEFGIFKNDTINGAGDDELLGYKFGIKWMEAAEMILFMRAMEETQSPVVMDQTNYMEDLE